MPADDRDGLADLWETLRTALIERAPALDRVLRDLEPRRIHRPSAAESRVALLAALLDADATVPATRRRLRALVDELIGAPPPDTISESEAPYRAGGPGVLEISPAHRDRVRLWIEAAGESELLDALAQAGGAVAAFDCARRHLRGLPPRAAMRYLAGIHFPVVVADAARRRWLVRFGLSREEPDNTAAVRLAVGRMETLARAAGTTPEAFEWVLGALCGAIERDDLKEAALCVARPRCAECPIRGRCSHHLRTVQTAGAVAEQRPASLAETLRPEDRPREKLSASGAEILSEAELLAIVLRSGTRGENAVAMAQRLLVWAGSLERLARASVGEIAAQRGVGRVRAITIKAALELARRLHTEDSRLTAPINRPRDAVPFLKTRFLALRKETFVALHLDTKNRVLRVATISEGLLNQTLVHPREAFGEALKDSAAAVIFAHNHPSGDPTPSRDDVQITRRLVQAGDVMGIRVLDHLIICKDRWYSFADEGMLRDE